MLHAAKPWVCAAAAVGPPLAWLLLGEGEQAATLAAGLGLLVCGQAPLALVVLAALPLFQWAPAAAPDELGEAMRAIGVTGPGTIAADPAALLGETRGLVWLLAAHALGRGAARSKPARLAAVAAVAAVGCFEGALGIAGGGGAPASGAIVHRGQFAALLELSLGAGSGLAAYAWAEKPWRERLDERSLPWAAAGAAAIALSLGGIAFSLSRTGIVAGLLAAAAAFVWFGGRRSWALGGALALLLALGWTAPRAIGRFERLAQQGGDAGRTAIWLDSVQLVEKHALTGVGLGSFPAAFERTSCYLPRKGVDNAHSDYLEWAVELGLPAALLLFGAIASALLAVEWPDKLAAGCAIGAVAVLLHATVDLPLQSPGLAALTAALLGLAAPAPIRGRMPAVALGLATLALAFVSIPSAQDAYLAAGQASAVGDLDRAVALYRQALDRNLHAAPAWLRLAEIERARGHVDRALLFARAARQVEPFTLRTEWPLAELELQTGHAAEAVDRLAMLVSEAPDLLDAALLTASRSGVETAALERLPPPDDPESAARYLAFLVRNGRAEALPQAYARLGSPELPEPYLDWLAREADFQP
ncbi:MAG: O-antigen ligase family protein [Bryobacterales bacterium]|nr:O-antigen ligase family protein [Bryobacterales bacterium]